MSSLYMLKRESYEESERAFFIFKNGALAGPSWPDWGKCSRGLSRMPMRRLYLLDRAGLNT